jgi:predicted dehydrogenase
MKKIGIGVIGCGGRIRGVLDNLLNATHGVEVRGVYDPDPAAIANITTHQAPGAVVYADYQTLLSDPHIDWVMIGAINCYHAEETIAAFAAGKHVFCEKPLATTLKDCLAMRAAWRASGKMFVIGFTLRYSPHVRKVKALLEEGVIGDIISMEFNETLEFYHGGYIHGDWRRHTALSGTHILEKCCHDIDMINWMVGSRASRVASFGGLNYFTPGNAGEWERLGFNDDGVVNRMKGWDTRGKINPYTAEKDIVDNQVAIIEYANQVRASFHASCLAALPERRSYICGTEGTLRMDVNTGVIEYRRAGLATPTVDASTGLLGGHKGDPVLADDLTACMLRNEPSRSTLDAGLDAAVTCFAIDEAMTTGTVVSLDEYWARVDSGCATEVRVG